MFSAQGCQCLYVALVLFSENLHIISWVTNHLAASRKHTQTTRARPCQAAWKKPSPFPAPSNILLCKHHRHRALTFENRHKLLGGKLNLQLACLGHNSKWKPSKEAFGKTQLEILISSRSVFSGLSLSSFLSRVLDLLQLHFSFLMLFVPIIWGGGSMQTH